MGVWIPDGDGTSTNLLKFALNETNIDNVLICFVVSMSTPWTIIESLNKWSNILREHLKKLNIPEKKRNDMLKQQIKLFQIYQEPDEKTATTPSSSNKLKSLLKNDDLIGGKNNDAEPASEANDDDVLLTLDPNILSKNLGIPIVVIATKSDCISILDKEMEYRIEHFDFIQYHIRKFCLECKQMILKFRTKFFFLFHIIDVNFFRWSSSILYNR
jgi:dynein light intermediate chain 1